MSSRQAHMQGREFFFLNTVEEPKYAHFVSRICDRCFIWEHTLTSLLINCTVMMQECTFTIIIFVVSSQSLIRVVVFLCHLFSELEVLQSSKFNSRSYTKTTKKSEQYSHQLCLVLRQRELIEPAWPELNENREYVNFMLEHSHLKLYGQ